MRNTLAKAARATGATLLALGLAFSVTNVAHAASATYYPVSSGSINGGFYSGSYSVTATKSSISVYSFSNSMGCIAAQNGQKSEMTTNHGTTCAVSITGGQSTVGDYAYYTTL
ncbi:hypothetical protein [Bifidobacterium cuniculi]|uniref:Uncharacterized protein n=1 Tax=Bifidobacterium cuniculi TaxID=1688 RepID=A0A087AQ96_9BIFI|nr:hypothetical protein [Bifidobacterium cuniculi]KFI60946.1 hypothetical protein BCUN_0922 [Bifidobacterium cuniculi]